MLDEKETTVYKRALDMSYQLKMKASREVFSEIQRKYPTMLFRWVLGGCVWVYGWRGVGGWVWGGWVGVRGGWVVVRACMHACACGGGGGG